MLLQPPPLPPRLSAPRSPHPVWRPTALILGALISIAVAGIVHDTLRQEQTAQRELTRQSISAGLQSHVNGKLDFIRFMRGLYDSSDFVSDAEFARFARIDPSIQDGKWWFSIAWAPRQHTSNPPASGYSAAVPPGDVFPVSYAEPAMHRGDMSDAAADPTDRAVMTRAAAERQMVVSQPHMLAFGGREGRVIKAFLPIFKSDGDKQDLQGFLVGSIALEGLFNDFLQDAFSDTDLSLRILAGNALVFASGPEAAQRAIDTLRMGDQQWKLEIGRPGEAVASSLWLPGLVLLTGFALTALLYLRLLRADTEYRRICEQVGLATAELASANVSLAERSDMLERVADDLRRTSHEAQLASAAKTVFLANMSHELRTPLNAIIGFSEVIAQRTFGDQSPRYAEYIQDIESSGRHLLSIIEDLLDMSRIELGQLQLREETVEPEELAQSVTRFVTHRANQRRIDVRCEGFDALPPVVADPNAMRQMLINLLVNAVKFSPTGGTVVLRGAVDADGIALSVEDNGPGIAAEDVERVFEPFWQSEAYRRTAREGVGLGLAITKRLVEAHGGSIALNPAPAGGTIATIRLPASRLARAKPQLAVVVGSL